MATEHTHTKTIHKEQRLMQAKHAASISIASNSTRPWISTLLILISLTLSLSPLASALAMHHKQDEAKSEESAQLAYAESFIDAFYSFDPSQLAPLMAAAEESKPRLLYYQGWAEGGNYIVLERASCTMEEANKVACPVTVQDDPVVALKTGFNVTDTFHLTFDGETLVAVDTSSNDQPIYYEARKWVEANMPAVMSGPCKNRNTEDATPGECARAMTKGYAAYYEALIAPAKP